MMKYLLLGAIICANSFQIGPIQQSLSNVHFEDVTGKGVSQQQLKQFINFANSASVFYKDDIKANLMYIQNQMNKLYADSQFKFVVHIQGSGLSGWKISIAYNEEYASISPGANLIYPNWSYFFMKDYVTKTKSLAYIQDVGQKGIGISEDLGSFINLTIQNQQKNILSCQCSAKINENIRNYLDLNEDGYWAVFCSSDNSGRYFPYVQSDLWIYTRPKSCYYAIYSM